MSGCPCENYDCNTEDNAEKSILALSTFDEYTAYLIDTRGKATISYTV